jgi:hypothetical protein
MESDLSIISITDPKAVSVIATALDRAGRSQPYVVRRGAFWYFADSPFSHLTEGSRYLVICDLLHDILGIDHPSDTRALVRIEDVSVDDEPDDLNKIADLLEGRHVPFQISLIPLFLDPGHSLEIHLGDRRRTVDAIHYMIAHGGTPIMHGTTHQYRGVSADDYEFWDEMADRPIGGDSSALALDRLRQGLLECFDNGIYPLAFETPHYGASASDYAAIARVFSESNERPMVAPDVTTTEFAPYPFVDHAGRYIVPEDLGYLPEANPDPKLVIDRARSLRVVRDGIASFYFHPFLDRSLLDQTVRGIQDLGYRFVSLREVGGSVDLDGRYAVRSASGKVRLTPRDEYWRMRRFNAQGQEIERVV